MHEPTYYNYQKRDLSDRSVKLELRQRIYSDKTNDFKITYMPFIVEVTHTTKWDDMIRQVKEIIGKLKGKSIHSV